MTFHLPPPAHIGSWDREERTSAAANSSLPPCYPGNMDYRSPARSTFSEYPQTANETRTVDVPPKGGLKSITLHLQMMFVAVTVVIWGVVTSTKKPGEKPRSVGFHALFTVIVVIQLVVITRQFRMSLAQEKKYRELAGDSEVLPRHRDSILSFDSDASAAPWNHPRPPLPIYVVQAPKPVEDDLISTPPPAYST